MIGRKTILKSTNHVKTTIIAWPFERGKKDERLCRGLFCLPVWTEINLVGKRGRLCLTWPGQEAISIVALVIVGGTTALQCGTQENDLLQIRTGLSPCLHDSTTTDDVEAWFTHSFLTTYRLNRQYSTSIVCEGVLFCQEQGTKRRTIQKVKRDMERHSGMGEGRIRRPSKMLLKDRVLLDSIKEVGQVVCACFRQSMDVGVWMFRHVLHWSIRNCKWIETFCVDVKAETSW